MVDEEGRQGHSHVPRGQGDANPTCLEDRDSPKKDKKEKNKKKSTDDKLKAQGGPKDKKLKKEKS